MDLSGHTARYLRVCAVEAPVPCTATPGTLRLLWGRFGGYSRLVLCKCRCLAAKNQGRLRKLQQCLWGKLRNTAPGTPSLAPVHWQWRRTYLLACPVLSCRLSPVASPIPSTQNTWCSPLRRPWDVGKKSRPYITWRYNGDSNDDDKSKALGFPFVPPGEPTSLLQRRT